MGVWDFIQDQVLGMKWLNELLGIGLSALGLDVNGRIGGSVQFFKMCIRDRVKGVNRVLYDLTPKPTGTIEWE